MNLPKIGMRTIKTGIAAFICALIGYTGIINNSFFAIGACVVSMQNTIKDSYDAGFNRIKGTILGGIFGFMMVYIFDHNILIASIGLVLAIYVCNILKLQSSILVCAITYSSIAYTISTQNPFSYSFHRTLDTTLGVVIGVLINYTIYKPNLLNDILSNIERLRDLGFHLVRNSLLSKNIDLDDYENKLSSLISIINKHDAEFYSDKNIGEYFEFEKIIMEFKEIKIHLYCLEKLKGNFTISKENLHYLNSIFGPEITNNFKALEDAPSNNLESSSVYNYHLNEILHSLEDINNWILIHSKKKLVL